MTADPAASPATRVVPVLTPMVNVVTVQLEGFNGPCVHRTVESALQELREILDEEFDGSMGGSVSRITVTVEEMNQTDLDALPEFDGY